MWVTQGKRFLTVFALVNLFRSVSKFYSSDYKKTIHTASLSTHQCPTPVCLHSSCSPMSHSSAKIASFLFNFQGLCLDPFCISPFMTCQTLFSFNVGYTLSITNPSPSSHSQHLKISFYFLFPSFPGSSPLSRPFQFFQCQCVVLCTVCKFVSDWHGHVRGWEGSMARRSSSL